MRQIPKHSVFEVTPKIKMQLKHTPVCNIRTSSNGHNTFSFFVCFFAIYVDKCTQMELIHPVLSLVGQCASH